jgi:hypothetical protein
VCRAAEEIARRSAAISGTVSATALAVVVAVVAVFAELLETGLVLGFGAKESRAGFGTDALSTRTALLCSLSRSAVGPPPPSAATDSQVSARSLSFA